MFRPILIVCFTVILLCSTKAQQPLLTDVIESLSYDQLELLDVTPEEGVDLNSNEVYLLELAGLITSQQYDSILSHRSRYGDFLSVYELQSIPTLDSLTIQRIKWIITVEEANETSHHVQKYRLIATSRFKTILERQHGYKNGRYRGNRLSALTRIRGVVGKGLRTGLLIEKDAGERGVDHLSGFIEYSPKSGKLKKIIFGDFRISSGHGLVFLPRFRIGKSSLTTYSVSGQPYTAPHTGTSEYGYYRGISSSIELTDKLYITAYFSHNLSDASLIRDTAHLLANLPVEFFRSINSSGLHRTAGESSRKGQLRVISVGGYMKLNVKHGHMAINHSSHFPRVPYLAVRPESVDTTITSVISHTSYSFTASHSIFSTTGEFAIDNRGHPALTASALLAPSKNVQLKVLARFLNHNFIDFGQSTFSENSRPRNEIGLYTGIHVAIGRQWSLNAYCDIWKHPKPQFNAVTPGYGREYLVRISSQRRHMYRAYVQYRLKRETSNSTLGSIVLTDETLKTNLRGHFEFHVSRGVELRCRAEGVFVLSADRIRSTGTLIYCDLIYKPIGARIGLTGRVALFDTTDYLTRVYAYENNVSGSFSIPAYHGKGSRVYLNCAVKVYTGMKVELRIARTRIINGETIGSGNDQINKPHRTELSLQVTWKL